MADDMPVGVLMFIALRYLDGRVLDALKREGYSVTLAQGRVAARIAEGGSRLTDLAEQAQVTKQTAQAVIDQLEKEGYVERVPDPADKRAKLIRLSEAGAKVSACANAEVAKVDAEWEAYLGERQMDQLRRALTKLREITDPYA